MSAAERPISPHLSIYRPQITSMTSIMHRFTGLALVAGAALLAYWLWAAAYAPAMFESLYECLASTFGLACLLGWTLAFYYHLANGIRHLFWDIGMGLEIVQATRSGWTVILLALLLTAFTWYQVAEAMG